MHFNLFRKYILSLFAIIPPLVPQIPFFVYSSKLKSENDKKKLARFTILYAIIILLLFSAIGETLLSYFGLTLKSAKITGGIILFLTGYSIINESISDVNIDKNKYVIENKNELDRYIKISAFSPLAMPFLSGPGAIIWTIINSHKIKNFKNAVVYLISIMFVLLTHYILYINFTKIIDYLSYSNILVIKKISGIILAMIGIQYFINGLKFKNIKY